MFSLKEYIPIRWPEDIKKVNFKNLGNLSDLPRFSLIVYFILMKDDRMEFPLPVSLISFLSEM